MLTMKNVISDAHENIRLKSNDVNIPLSNEDKELMQSMVEYLINSIDEEMNEKYDFRAAVGLAAPQLNIQKRIIAVRLDEENEFVLANPKIIRHSVQKIYLPNGEGCLSVNEKHEGIINRYKNVTIRGYDIENNLIDIRVSGYLSIVFQHEIDHLNGVLFYDHINKNNPFLVVDNAQALEV